MILGSSPMSRSPGPAEFGLGCPLPEGGPLGSQERTGRPCPVTGCTPVSVPPTSVPRGSQAVSVHTLRAIRVSAGQYPGGARAFSSPLWRGDLIGLLGPVYSECPKLLLRTFYSLWPQFSRVSESPPAKSGKLDITRPAAAGSRPATDQSVQETRPQPMQPFPKIALLRMSPKSANEIPR
jgi:hypothetical protein